MIQDVAGEKAFTVRLTPEVHRKLEELARRMKRSVSAQAAYIIEEALRETENTPRAD